MTTVSSMPTGQRTHKTRRPPRSYRRRTECSNGSVSHAPIIQHRVLQNSNPGIRSSLLLRYLRIDRVSSSSRGPLCSRGLCATSSPSLPRVCSDPRATVGYDETITANRHLVLYGASWQPKPTGASVANLSQYRCRWRPGAFEPVHVHKSMSVLPGPIHPCFPPHWVRSSLTALGSNTTFRLEVLSP